MQRLLPSLDIQQTRVDFKSICIVSYSPVNREVNALHILKNKEQSIKFIQRNRLFDLLNHYFDNAKRICNELLAVSQLFYYDMLTALSSLLYSNAGAFSSVCVKTMFVSSITTPRFKAEERGAAMA